MKNNYGGGSPHGVVKQLSTQNLACKGLIMKEWNCEVNGGAVMLG